MLARDYLSRTRMTLSAGSLKNTGLVEISLRECHLRISLPAQKML
jgi:hypothetical protein